jgi:hypothetical protein
MKKGAANTHTFQKKLEEGAKKKIPERPPPSLKRPPNTRERDREERQKSATPE